MRLPHLALLSILLLPPTIGATAIDYTIMDGSRKMFEFVTGAYIPDLPQFVPDFMGGSLQVFPGEWFTCYAQPGTYCTDATFQINNSIATWLTRIYDPVENFTYPAYGGEFATDFQHIGTFSDQIFSGQYLQVSLTDAPVSFAPEPSTWLFCGFTFLGVGLMRTKLSSRLLRCAIDSKHTGSFCH